MRCKSLFVAVGFGAFEANKRREQLRKSRGTVLGSRGPATDGTLPRVSAPAPSEPLHHSVSLSTTQCP